MPCSVDRLRASASRIKSIHMDDYADPFDTKAMTTFIWLVTSAGLWFAFATSVSALMGGAS
jgi:hypothetical protein